MATDAPPKKEPQAEQGQMPFDTDRPQFSRGPATELPLKRKQMDARLRAEFDLMKRSTEAAESAARWSAASLGIALAALAVAAWPHIAEWLRG